jgi:hypothetical protein
MEKFGSDKMNRAVGTNKPNETNSSSVLLSVPDIPEIEELQIKKAAHVKKHVAAIYGFRKLFLKLRAHVII